MANYTGIYQSDIGLNSSLIRLQVFSQIGNTRVATSVDFDADYLPEVYRSYVQQVTETFRGCEFPLGRVRYAKIYYNSIDFLHVDLPFKPSTSEYEQFFLDLSSNSLVSSIGLEGELISNDFYFRRLL